jgi:predicted Fe-Mo cluster-binding NifX family protein
MAHFTSENAAEHGRRGGQESHQHLEQQYADLVLTNQAAASRLAELIRQGYRLVLALRVVKVVDQMNEGGR